MALAVSATLTLGAWRLDLLVILLTAHLIAHALGSHAKHDSLPYFVAEQMFQLAVLGLLAYLFPDVVARGWWQRLGTQASNYYFAGLCILSGSIVCLNVGAVVLRLCTAPLIAQIEESKQIDGLKNGGLYIGLLERAIVMFLMLINQPTGVGFLITAKSILRFGDIKDAHQRKATEYIIIGTFMSFGWGLVVAELTVLAFRHWLPTR